MSTTTDIRITLKPRIPSSASSANIETAVNYLKDQLVESGQVGLGQISESRGNNQYGNSISLEMTFSTKSDVQDILVALAPVVKDSPYDTWVSWLCVNMSQEGVFQFTDTGLLSKSLELHFCNECGMPLQTNTNLHPTCDCMDEAKEILFP
jgi:hypothetical protein